MTFLSCHPGHVNPENPRRYAVNSEAEWRASVVLPVRRVLHDESSKLVSYRQAGPRLERAPL